MELTLRTCPFGSGVALDRIRRLPAPSAARVYAAVKRRTLDDKNPDGWIPAQKISVEDTIRAFTSGSAFAEFQEKAKGTIEVGKLADFVILSDDIFIIDPVKIRDVRILTTVMDGKIVYEGR